MLPRRSGKLWGLRRLATGSIYGDHADASAGGWMDTWNPPENSHRFTFDESVDFETHFYQLFSINYRRYIIIKLLILLLL